MSLINAITWDKYKDIINQAHDTFNQHTIVWKRSLGGLDRNGEDNLSERFENIELKGLIDYNYIRKWPITNVTTTGELDRQTMVLILNIKYLSDNGWLNVNNNFNFNFTSDRFIDQGITYKAFGDTPLSQAYDNPLHIMLVLQRDEIITGNSNI